MNEQRRVSPDRTAKRRVMLILFCALAGAVAPARWPCPLPSAQAAPPSYSRLSAHLILNYTAGARQIVAAHPRVLKILDTHSSMLAAAREFKSGTPNGILVLRIYTSRRYTLANDPAASAQDFWNAVLAPAINSLSPSDRALIDYVEGPNEGDSTPTWASIQEAQWFNSFWLTLAPLIGNAGFKPCAFSIAVGNPPGDTNYVHQVLDTIVPALRLCKSYGGGWSYHSYTLLYTKDAGVEIWYSLRYRQYYNYFAQYYPDLSDLPLILTEGGVDGQAAPGGPGWKAYDAARYQDWLAWFDQQLMQDPYVVGCTLFQSGDTQNWFSFDLEPIAPWLAGHLATTPPPGPPAPPVNLTATAFGPTSVYLNWSATADTDRYNVKRSATTGGPYVTIASPTANSYTDTSLTTGATYYYVVSALNAAGESANSAQAGATLLGGYAVNSGGGLAGSFAPDACYAGGNAYSTTAAIDLGGLTDPAPEAVYRSERWASPSFTYTFAGLAAGAPYNVRLHFAEIYFTGAGQRRFHVAINGTPVLSEFDIVAAAGAANKGVIRSFTADADSSGQIIIQFSAGSADNPKSSGIEVQPLPPRAPAGLTATPGNARVVLNWTAPAGALRYNLKRGTTEGGPYATIAANLTATTWTDTTALNGRTYYYVVTASNPAGESPNSNEAVATPVSPPSAPTGLAASPGDRTVALTWNAVSGASGYNVKRATTSGGPYAVVAPGVTATTHLDTALTNGTRYYYVVSAFNYGGESANSLPVSAVPYAPPPPGDLDRDNDVDLSDFSFLQYCFNGPNRAPRLTGCEVADLDRDADVDLGDFAIFQACFNGPNQRPKCE